jgi:hypothetical protein
MSEDSASTYLAEEGEGYPDPNTGFPVRIVTDESGKVAQIAPEFGSCMTWPVPQIGAPAVQVLTRRLRRYKAKLFIVSVTGATTLIMSSKLDALTSNSQGATYPAVAGFLPDWESQQPLYMLAAGGTLVVSVIDESYGE